MGKLRDIINSADNSAEVAQEVKENLHILMSLADSKVQQFSDEIEINLRTGKTTDDLSVPITKVTNKYMESRALTTDSKTDVLTEVSNIINGVVADHSATGVISGIAQLANSALKTVMGTGEGTEQEVRRYTVCADYPAIVRFDFAFWARKIQAESIKKHCETALACVMYKSAVDVSKLEFNDFLTLYAPILNAGYGSDKTQLEYMVDQSEKIYQRFLQNSSHRAAGGGKFVQADTSLDPEKTKQLVQVVLENKEPRGMCLSEARKPTVGAF